MNVTTEEGFPDEVQAFAAGLVEGYITGEQIKMHWNNTIRGYCEPPLTDYCKRLQDFFQQNIDFMESKIYSKDPIDNQYWKHVSLLILLI